MEEYEYNRVKVNSSWGENRTEYMNVLVKIIKKSDLGYHRVRCKVPQITDLLSGEKAAFER